MKNLAPIVVTAKNGTEYEFTRLNNDINGNPMYAVHFFELGLKSHNPTPVTKQAGLRKYPNCKHFGGGFKFQSHNIIDDANLFESLGLKN